MSRSTALLQSRSIHIQGLLKSFNKRLAEKLFMIMDTKEFQTGKDSDKWVKHVVSGVVNELNKEKNPMTGLAATAMK